MEIASTNVVEKEKEVKRLSREVAEEERRARARARLEASKPTEEQLLEEAALAEAVYLVPLFNFLILLAQERGD